MILLVNGKPKGGKGQYLCSTYTYHNKIPFCTLLNSSSSESGSIGKIPKSWSSWSSANELFIQSQKAILSESEKEWVVPWADCSDIPPWTLRADLAFTKLLNPPAFTCEDSWQQIYKKQHTILSCPGVYIRINSPYQAIFQVLYVTGCSGGHNSKFEDVVCVQHPLLPCTCDPLKIKFSIHQSTWRSFNNSFFNVCCSRVKPFSLQL